MGSYAVMYVGDVQITMMRRGVPDEILAVFTDEMLSCLPVEPDTDEHVDEDDVEGQELTYRYWAPGSVIADRLDALGFTPARTIELIDEALKCKRHEVQQYSLWEVPGIEVPSSDESAQRDLRRGTERTLLEGYAARDWIDDFRRAAGGIEVPVRVGQPGSLSWLLEIIEENPDGLDVGFMIRAVNFKVRAALLATPDAEVSLDVTDIVYARGGWDDEDDKACASALSKLRSSGAAQAPIVVLTEGKTDIQVLEPALSLLLPHLADLVRFMDYAERPQGGAGPLVNMIRSFAAAGIANRVVALFDNDTAASDALRKLNKADLPANIKVFQYPNLEFARNYPTLGPPTESAPYGHLVNADINGLACSIELYVGQDVLMTEEGILSPVQWRSYIEGARQYQGEIMNKSSLLQSYKSKISAARADETAIGSQDWSGVRAILDLIRNAFL